MPLIAINPIPGQETENADFFEKKGTAIWIKENEKFEFILSNIFENDDIILNMKKNIKQLAKRNSTSEICKILLSNNLF